QDRGRAAGEARDAEARAFEGFDLLKIFAADEIIRRRVARSGDSFQAAALLIPQDNAVRIDVRDMQLAGDKRPELEIGATDEDELDLHALRRVEAFFLRDEERQIIEIARDVAGLDRLGGNVG